MEHNLVVYVVDDEQDQVDSLIPLLVLAGYDAYGASTAEEVLAFMEKHRRPIVACLDLMLKNGVTGADVLRQMRERADQLGVPIRAIFVSGRDLDEGKVAALAAGGRAYEMKPVHPDVVIRHIHNAKLDIDRELELAEYKQLAAELTHRATHDRLTGLLNSTGFLEHAQQVLHDARRKGTRTTCIYIDADKFKAINDTFGHAFGDTVIRAMGECIKQHTHDIRRTDVVSRLMGDEFVVLMPDTTAEQARRVADLVVEAIGSLAIANPQGGRVHVQASAGVADLPGEDVELEKLLALAEEAMYKVKHDKAGEGGGT